MTNLSPLRLWRGGLFVGECNIEVNGPGNALVAAYDATTGGSILWSWHIWVTDNKPGNTTANSGGNTNGANTLFMDRNLGALSSCKTQPSAADAHKYMGVYYQQGRKEPFTGQANSTTVNTPTQIYKADGTIINGGANLGGYTYQASSVSQIYAAINTPTTHFSQSPNWNWHSSNPDSWTRANYPAQSTAKSIFDPCPYGYRVPTSNDNSNGNSDFFGFTTSLTGASNSINYGAIWIGSWWPTSGYRNYNSATFGGVGYEGDYWSASPYSTSYYAYILYFYSGCVIPVDYNNRSYGFSLRCVQE